MCALRLVRYVHYPATPILLPATEPSFTSRIHPPNHPHTCPSTHPNCRSPGPPPPPATSLPPDPILIVADWTAEEGWATPQLVPYGPMEIMFAASVLHYSTSWYEGMKLYRGYDGHLRLFRPEANCARLRTSAERISLPDFDPEQVHLLIRKLCAVDGPRWLPSPGNFLYIRPTIVRTDSSLGVRVPHAARLFVIICCWATIQTADPTGMRLVVGEEGAVRAWPGGTGAAKVGANYGPTLQKHGRADHEVTESGSSNLFVLWRAAQGGIEVVTSPLERDLVLPGVTRNSILMLLRERLNGSNSWSYMMGEILSAYKENRLLGAFAVGTAYFVTPVSNIDFHGEGIRVPVDGTSHVALLQGWMADIMYGKVQRDCFKYSITMERKKNT
ncbi:branched-chain amino acid aminotransferase II [Aspergillus ellipticus CBS 707.79]|uniref:Branched-chain amino acid aminotransferase II n=1 Tax=Aspergillus ellipticus CBS 707.79 TaxID=1448320 RepID=A0A319D2C2_9EURO|nr:branched-chain amino acid aminotransferase II [Aspergillus ellipticus CBS 707.79]